MCSAHAVEESKENSHLGQTETKGVSQCGKADALPSIWWKTLTLCQDGVKNGQRDKELVYESASSIILIHLQLEGAHIKSCLAVKRQRNEWKSFHNTDMVTCL